LLTVYLALTVSSKLDTCTTFDEPYHLINGVSFWVTDDYRLSPEAVLMQRWAALPAYLGHARFPSLEQPAWHQSNNWELGYQFLYDLANDADRLLLQARCMMAVCGVGLGLVVFFWSRHFFGSAGGLVSLAVYAFCPSFLAHGGLVTADVGATLFFALTLAAAWSLMQRLSPSLLLASSLAFAGLLCTKMSGVLVIPMIAILVALRIAVGRPWRVSLGRRAWVIEGRMHQALAALGVALVHLALAALVIWALFGFRFAMFHHAEPGRDYVYTGDWDDILAGSGATAPLVRWARDHRLLPEAYLYNFAYVVGGTKARPGFLNGALSTSGFRVYYPYCFLVKTPLPTLLLLVVAAFLWVRGWWIGAGGERWQRLADSLYRAAPLWVLVLLYGGVAIASAMNIGHRHLFPIYPAVFIAIGATGAWLPGNQGKWRPGPTLLVGALLGWLAIGTLSWWPHYLAYFNPLIGEPGRAYRHLVDSSLDWGEELPELRRWLDDHGVNRPDAAYLSYFGTGDVPHYGIHATVLPGAGWFESRNATYLQEWRPGTYCISATMLQAIYRPPYGRWTDEIEGQYQHLLRLAEQWSVSRGDAARRKSLLETRSAAEWQKLLIDYDWHRLHRLFSYLRVRREPDSEIGNAILIYRLTTEDLQAALRGPPVE
jgi:hypothetical protein